MGCVGSTQSMPVEDSGEGVVSGGPDQVQDYILTINERSPHVRLDHSSTIKSIPIEGETLKYTLKYCYVSQRGYYPNALSKANQDSYAICERFLNDKNAHLFGIFDGHGEYGDNCSYFAAEKVPKFLKTELLSYHGNATFETNQMEEAYGNAFIKANKAMHKDKFDDSLSGTTAITAYILGDTLYVANVGDSRAIIASADGSGKNRSSPLSLDQTPFRKDERERLKKKGARIMTLDQVEGNDTLHENWGNGNGDEIDESGDPPRVWDSTLERPGCAFTRSLGDSVAEQVGVYAVPEILTWKLTPQDRFMVIASDGVFEFLTSQAVVDMVSEFDDPLEAAKHVVSESYRLWLTYDDRTDDITIIIVSFGNFVKPSSQQSSSSKRSAAAKRESDAKTIVAVESKPVRRVMSKEKRKVISESWADEEKEEFNFEANSSPKTPEELARIEEMVRANFMFQSLSKQQRDQIFMVMKLRTVTAGELIIQEGDAGDAMYIIDSGEFSVLKRDESGINQPVFSYTSPGAAFGELSLMYGKPRAASVRAKTAGRLWSISRQAFRSVLMKRRQSGLLKTMQELPFFVNISYPQLQRICDLSSEETFNDNEVVATYVPNDRSWTVMVVLQGRLFLVKPDGSKDSPRSQGMFLARVHLENTNLKAVASGRTKIARISSAVFSEIMGGDGDEMLRSFQDYSNIVRHATFLTKHENLKIQGVSTRNNFQLQSVMTILGDYAYVGNFIDITKSNAKVTIKVIAKERANQARMVDRLLQEKAYLVALSSKTKYVASIATKCVDPKVLLLVYEDNFVCDIAAAITNDALSLNAKKFCTAAIFSALEQLHLNGVMHRFLNSSAVYMTDRCVPKLTDLRYAKKMDGSKTFTVCGDPLYFAPEIVGQQGYDYSADLWAFGILAYEIFEGHTPFGSADTEETQLFRLISSYMAGQLNFSQNTPPAAREMILAILDPRPHFRLGYKSHRDVFQLPFFEGTSQQLGLVDPGIGNIGITAAQDSSAVFQDSELDAFSSSAFDNF